MVSDSSNKTEESDFVDCLKRRLNIKIRRKICD
jgi:hypothetical protein